MGFEMMEAESSFKYVGDGFRGVGCPQEEVKCRVWEIGNENLRCVKEGVPCQE